MPGRYRVTDSPFQFITNTTVRWTPIFIAAETCDIVIDSLAYCRKAKGLLVYAYVVMPTHFHAVVAARDNADISAIMRDMKRHTSRRIIAALESMGWELPQDVFRNAGQRSGGRSDHKVWQEDFHPVGIEREDVLRVKLDYLHNNPVRKGLVSSACDWWYSSARFHERGDPEPMELDSIEW